MVTPGEIQHTASFVNIMKPDPMLLELWISAMASGDYKFGFGLLRSGEDEFDPFGVLAAISQPDWRWDDREGGWAIADDAIYVPPNLVSEWLSLKPPAGLKGGTELTVVETFQAQVIRIADGSSSFAEVVELLRQGVVTAAREKRRLQEAKDTRRRLMLASPLESDRGTHLRIGYDRPFYAIGDRW
jgi:hypothetical protein